MMEQKKVHLDFSQDEFRIPRSTRLPKLATARGRLGRKGVPLADIRFQWEYQQSGQDEASAGAWKLIQPVLEREAEKLKAEGWELTTSLSGIHLDRREITTENNATHLLVFFVFMMGVLTIGIFWLFLKSMDFHIIGGYYQYTGATLSVRRAA